MHVEIRYVTSFTYPSPVRESHNVLRARPTTDDHQRLIDYQVRVEPPARVVGYTDYWGTHVDAFGVRRAHDRLTVAADAVVETGRREAPADPFDAAAYGDGAFADRWWVYLQPSPHARWNGDVADRASSAVDGLEDGLEMVRAVYDAVRAALRYVPGATYVGMDVGEVLAAGKGVCQDFAHLGLAMFRSVGIPARYVSGYFYAEDQSVGAAPEQAEIDVQTHAWIEVAVPHWGWWALDPTNPLDVGERHVKIGHGRDYDDVMPLRGVYHGAVEHTLGVSVRISRERLTEFQQTQMQQ